MQAAYLIKKGKADKSFEWREVEIPAVRNKDILIKVSAFGLNVIGRLSNRCEAARVEAKHTFTVTVCASCNHG